MRHITAGFVLVLMFMGGCSSGDPPPIIRRIGQIDVFDVGNVGDATDIRVRWTIETIADIDEFWVMVIPVEDLNSFTERQAVRLSTDQYFQIKIRSSDEQYSHRLPLIRDVNGAPIVTGKEYAIRIMSVGDRLNQLSLVQSNRFMLTDKAKYAGLYEGTISENYWLTSVGWRSSSINLELTWDGSVYQGQLESAPDVDGNTYSTSVSWDLDEVLDPFTLMLLDGYAWDFYHAYQGPLIPTFRCGPLDESKKVKGTVTISEDLALEINLVSCFNSSNGERKRRIEVERIIKE